MLLGQNSYLGTADVNMDGNGTWYSHAHACDYEHLKSSQSLITGHCFFLLFPDVIEA